MNDKNPSAFPISGSQYRHTAGMSLRDYFAAQAMALAYKVNKDRNDANFGVNKWNFDVKDLDYIATVAYDFADSMMEARKE